jgi:hypothetical protein
MRNVSDTNFLEKFKTRVLCSVTFPENRVVFEIMFKNMAETEHITWRMPFTWITMATETHSEYVTPFPQQQCLHENASLLRAYVHCLSGEY